MLLALDCVDYVSFFEEDDPYNIVNTLKPDVLVKGGDWPIDKIIGADLVKSWGGKVMNIPVVEGRSTTNLIEIVKERYGNPNMNREGAKIAKKIFKNNFFGKRFILCSSSRSSRLRGERGFVYGC